MFSYSLAATQLAEQQAHNPRLVLDAGDDVYLVVFWAGDHLDHGHVAECEMAEPRFEVEKVVQQRLLAAWDSHKSS